jgi:putative endonuclease
MDRAYIYILTNDNHSVLYVGVTTNLHERILQHRRLEVGFTSRYNLTKLIYVEQHSDVRSAIEREKQLKSWSRRRKEELIATSNPTWQEIMPME